MCSDTFQGKKIWKIRARCFFLEELQITTLWNGQIKQHKKMPCSLGRELYVFCLSSITQGCLKAFTRIQIFCALTGWSGTQCMRCCSRAKHWTCCWSCDFPGPNSALRSLGALALCFCMWFINKSDVHMPGPRDLKSLLVSLSQLWSTGVCRIRRLWGALQHQLYKQRSKSLYKDAALLWKIDQAI